MATIQNEGIVRRTLFNIIYIMSSLRKLFDIPNLIVKRKIKLKSVFVSLILIPIPILFFLSAPTLSISHSGLFAAVERITLPTGVSAQEASLASKDGILYMTWLEHFHTTPLALRCRMNEHGRDHNIATRREVRTSTREHASTTHQYWVR